MKRFVVDASTLVSGVASRPGGGAPWLLLSALLDFDFEAVVCPTLIDEFRKALENKYFRERFDPDDLMEIVAGVTEAAVEFEDPSDIKAVLRDPDDDYLLTLARESGAEAIITGDRDLLDHVALEPKAIGARAACRLLGLLEDDVVPVSRVRSID